MKKEVDFYVRRFASSADFNGYTLGKMEFKVGEGDRQPLLHVNREVVTLEDEFRTKKVFGETRVQGGLRYPIKVTWSPKFKRNLVEVFDTPGFTSVRWHSLNTEDQTEGCLGLGNSIGKKCGKPAIFGGLAAGVEKFVTDLVAQYEAQGYACFVTYLDEDRK